MGELANKKKLLENISKAADSIKDIALEGIPGGAVVKAIWNYGSELQTSRSLKFLGDFQRILEQKLGREFYEDELQNEDFHDLFYSIMSEVHKTRSERKLGYYRNILVNQITDTSANEILANKIVQTVNELNELQLLILQIIWECEVNPNIYDIHMSFEMKNAYVRLDKRDELPKGIEIEQVLEAQIFLYFLEELISKGLVVGVEQSGELLPPLRELKETYHDYILSKCQYSNTHIQYNCSGYGQLLCEFIKGYDGK